jgi:hypothetical protein
MCRPADLLLGDTTFLKLRPRRPAYSTAFDSSLRAQRSNPFPRLSDRIAAGCAPRNDEYQALI